MTTESTVRLSEEQAFEAMRHFLQAYWERAKQAQVADVLSDTQPAFFADTVTADPAAWEDWRQAVQRALSSDA